MTVQYVIDLAKNGELKNLAVRDDNAAIIGYINLGIVELYKRFTIKTDVEVVKLTPRMSVYTLQNTNVSNILSIYDANGKELLEPMYKGDEDFDYIVINYNTIMFRNPLDENVMVVYKASPEAVTLLTDEIDIPMDMLEALLNYVGYRAHGSVNGSIQAESNTHYARFDKSCAILLSLGYKYEQASVRPSTTSKGFV